MTSPIKRKPAAKKTKAKTVSDGTPEHYALSELYLDNTNPRLGGHGTTLKSQQQILDYIVSDFGVDDVLSSLAVNGYFEAEPMVGVRKASGKGIRIAEGNRRLAACLILAGDKRAKNHKKRTQKFQEIRARHKTSLVEEVPVTILRDSIDLFSYLGVRHIAASQPWDSYAKAAWIAKFRKDTSLSLEHISEMIGDQHRTVSRTLEGYYFVNQLIKANRFDPATSSRPGRGSNPQYPFSWIYTALGYGTVRKWLDLGDMSAEIKVRPLKTAKLQNGSDLLLFLFGDEPRGLRSCLSDSREIPDLANLIQDPAARRMLKKGKTVRDLQNLAKSPLDRVSDNLLDAQENLRDALIPISEGDISVEEADELLDDGKRVNRLAREVHSRLREISSGDDE